VTATPFRVLTTKEEWQDQEQERTLRKSYRFGTTETRYEIEHYRRSYQVTDYDRALGSEPQNRAQRADRQRVGTAIERVQAKQRATDRTHHREQTSERPSRPRPREQRGQPGPERATG
jgi:hypothetical protein